jgi:hypothetical protein
MDWSTVLMSGAIGVVGTLLGVLLGDRLADRQAGRNLRTGWLVDLRRLLSRELDNVLLVQRRFQHETGSREDAIGRWKAGAVGDESELTMLLDVCDLGSPAERVAIVLGQTALGTAVQEGRDQEIAHQADALVRIVMKTIAQIDMRLGIKTGTRSDWERGWDGDLSPRA